MKLRCISKSWRRLIGSEKFIKTHLQNSTKNKALLHHRAILSFTDHKLKQSSLPPLLNEADIHKPSPFVDELSISPAEEVLVVGCCNGLACILKKLRRFSLVNPSSRISKGLPYIESDGRVLKSGFGWDESSDDYKVFALQWDDSRRRVGKIYSSKTNSWKIVKHNKGFRFTHKPGYFLRGKLHWCGGTIWEVVTLNLKTEEFGTMELPRHRGRWFYTSLGVVRGSLNLLRVYHETVVEVWVMKEYGVNESWEKVIDMLPVVYEPYDIRIGSAPIGLGPNGEILLIYGSAFLVYHPKDCVFRPYKKISSLCGMFLYVESLVSPL